MRMKQTNRYRACALGLFLTAFVFNPDRTTGELVARTSSQSVAPQSAGTKKKARRTKLTKEARLDIIRRAQVWMRTNISGMDLRVGPQGPGAFTPDERVPCDYVHKKLPGTSLKFDCAVSQRDVVKVRYGANNPKVEAEVVATRLLWALGFGADGVYPVRVTCRGCSSNPWTQRQPVPGQQVFDLAAIERTPQGDRIDSEHEGGWTWPELDLIQEAQGGAPLAQRDALKLIAVFMQHSDNKPVQERLICLPGGRTETGGCDKPFMMMHDVGLTFGHADFFNRNATAGLNFVAWSTTPIWRDASTCEAHMSRSLTGTLGNPRISEGGRQFLADLLVQLSDRQLHDLFAVAHVDRRSRDPDRAGQPPAAVDEWVAAFELKREEIVNAHCPS
jgi:hypothetical protein